MPSVELDLTVFAVTDVGRVRANNEDAFVVSELAGAEPIHSMSAPVSLRVEDRGVLLAVSDGMGGEQAGEVASALALSALRRGMSTVVASSAEAALRDCVESANREVWTAAQEAGREGMGATLTAVLLQGGYAYVAEIGDSRAYLLRGRRLKQLTHDQSYVQRLVDFGVLNRRQANRSEYRNVILQAMGAQPTVVVALNRLRLRRGDRLLLCSDGLSGQVDDDDMQRILLATPGLAAACRRLLERALSRGGDDNITIVLAEIEGEGLPALTGDGPISLRTVQAYPTGRERPRSFHRFRPGA
jgi:PPM family protein phosphatase